MDPRNHYTVQALFKDTFQYYTTDVLAESPAEAETLARLKSLHELLIASVTPTASFS